jgi:two-component system cell cycle response regulator
MPARILVVDDHFYNVKLLEARLLLAGYEVGVAGGGPEALSKIGDFQPDLVLLDVMMPGMDGYEVTRRIRRDPETADLPVILVSALDKRSDREAGLEAGADDFLTKPVEDAQLLPAVRRFARGSRARRLQKA